MLSAMSPTHLDQLSADELRQLAQQLATVASQTRLLTEQDARLADKDKELHWRQTRIDQLTHELALHKRWRFASRRSTGREQRQLFENDRYRSGGDGDRAGAVVHAIRQTEGPGQTPAAAGPSAAHRDSPRTRLDHLCLWFASYAASRDVAERSWITPQAASR